LLYNNQIQKTGLRDDCLAWVVSRF